MRVRQRPDISRLTHAAKQEDEEEGARHRNDGAHKDAEDGVDGLEPAHHAKHAAAAEQQEQVEGQARGRKADERDAHDNQVEHAPSAVEEWPEPAAKQIHAELGGEDKNKYGVELIQQLASFRASFARAR